MKSLSDSYVLHNGVKIPCVGFGTGGIPDGDVVVSSVKTAIDAGYRHIDTAAMYANEVGVGASIRQSGVDRKELFITTKLKNDEHGYESTLKAFDVSMDKLGLEYIDLYLIHWPNPPKYRDRWQQVNAETWKAMEELYESGRVRAIGISNFLIHHMVELQKTLKIQPMVNQIRLCPGDTQDEVVAFCREHKILLEAYSPFGVGKIFDKPEVAALAEKYGKTVAQVCVRWGLQRGYLPLPKSLTPARIKENAQVFDFELDAEDVALLASFKGICGYAEDPDTNNL